MWHCLLCHISEKHMKKLHNDGILTQFDSESYETCEACLFATQDDQDAFLRFS
jgi:hypothetical protein